MENYRKLKTILETEKIVWVKRDKLEYYQNIIIKTKNHTIELRALDYEFDIKFNELSQQDLIQLDANDKL